MIGFNTIELNQATMLEALNCYFGTIYKNAPVATAILEKTEGSTSTVYRVTVRSPTKAVDAP